MVLIDSVYVHESGGKSLLVYLASELNEKNIEFYLLVDSRFPESELLNYNYFKLNKSSESERKFFYLKNKDTFSKVLCFANIPPPISLSVPVFVFFHNVLLVQNYFFRNGYSFVDKCLFLLKRAYLYIKLKKDYKVIVQTDSVKNLFSQKVYFSANNILVIPFFSNKFEGCSSHDRIKNEKFVYVADGVRQKNHLNLLKAWEILFTDYNLNLELHLTIPAKFSKLINLIHILNSKGLNIINHGICDFNQVKQLYLSSEYLIYPSLAESFGLPLLEGASCGCKVVVSNLDYYKYLINPTAVFNPYRPSNIAFVVYNQILNPNSNRTSIIINNMSNKLVELIA
ncbi:glycosyltransferase [Aquirufa antheringensis]